MSKFFFENRYLATLIIFIICLYYKFFLFGKIPFPGDLLVGSYLPWLDYYKIPVQNPLISDVFSQLILWKYLSIDSIRAFQWPLWNPYSLTGAPLLANYQSAALYPLNILLFLPKYFGWGIFIFSQTLIAATTMFIYLKNLTKNILPSLIGAIIFALSSLMTTWLELGTAGHAISWLPLSLYLVDKFLSSGKSRYFIFLIFSISLTILAGNVQITIYSTIIVFFYSLIVCKKIQFFSVLVSLTLAILLTAVQLLPSLDLFYKSIRPSENYIQESNYGLLPLREAFKFFMADFFGNPVTRNYWGFLNYSETSPFVGTLTLPLVLFSIIFLKKYKISIFFSMLLFSSLILAFANPISSSIYQIKIPFLTSSFASRMLFVATFSISILVSLSINQIITLKEGGKFLKTVIWSWATIFGILLGTIVSSFIIPFRNSLLPTLLITAYLIILLPFKAKRYMIFSILLIFLMFDLGRYFLKFNPFVSKDLIFPTTPAIEFLKNQKGIFRIGREHAEVFPPNVWIAYNLQSLEGYDPLYLNQYGKLMHYLNGGDLRSGTSGRYAELSQKYDSPFIDSANVKYFIGILRNESGDIRGNIINPEFLEAGYKVVFQDGSTVILENPTALDRAYFAKSIKVQNINESQETIMSDKSFNPRDTILLSDNLAINTVSGNGQIEILSYTPNKVIIQTQTEKDEVLVLADQFEEGWRAKIDNADTKISRANLIFRAVRIPAGTHEIKFSYLPKSFEVGLKISLATIGVIFMLSLNAIKKKKF